MHDEEEEEFDRTLIRKRELDVLSILAQHIAALSPDQLWQLKDEGAVLINLGALETDSEFALDDLTIAFVDADESGKDVERRTGKIWISSFRWLLDVAEDGSITERRVQIRHQEVLKQVLSFDWFELVIWASEDRWMDGTNLAASGD